MVLQREQEAKRKFTEMELENAGLKGQLAMLERVLAEGPCRVINQQGGRLGGGSEDMGNAAGSDGGHQGEGVGSGAGPITHHAPTSAAIPATDTDPAPSSGFGFLKLQKPINWSWLFWTLIDKFFFNGVVGFLTNWGAARTSSMSDPNLAEAFAVALGKVLQENNNATVTTTAAVSTDVTLVSHPLIMYRDLYVS